MIEQMFGRDERRRDFTGASSVETTAQDRHHIPSGLDHMPPGPNLGAILSSIDRTKLSGHDAVIVMRARARQVAHDQAQLYADIAEVSRCADPGMARSQEELEFAADEIRTALNLTRRAADSELSFALELEERLPRVWESLASGDIDLRRAKTIYHQTRNLPTETARGVVQAVIDDAAGLTSGQLCARIRKLCIDIDTEAANSRYERSKEERRLASDVNPEGTANLYGFSLPPHGVGRALRRINRIARRLKHSGDPRTIHQICADIFLDLLNGDEVQDIEGGVVIHVDLATLVELDDRAGELPGFGAVISDIARQVAAENVDGEWRWIATHPDSAAVLADGTTRRRPTAAQRRYVEARDPTCVFPGCRMPATDCDLDHYEEWSGGGQTFVDNLPPACRHDHRVRHRGNWRYRRSRNGEFIWTSPLGHSYITKRFPP